MPDAQKTGKGRHGALEGDVRLPFGRPEFQIDGCRGGIMTCWICGGEDLTLVRKGTRFEDLAAANFRVTDSDYGHTGDIFRCRSCGFYQCSKFTDVLELYEEMDDQTYEGTSSARSLQAERTLRTIGKFRTGGRLLDVGAGSGILVGEAIRLGYQAEGIEPSKYLQSMAKEKNLPIRLGVLSNQEPEAQYDVVTLIDVIEHVSNPVELLSTIRHVLRPQGVAVVVTPDVGSFAARLLGWKWWHFRYAHIGYFDRKTFLLAIKHAGLNPIHVCRPTWYFSFDYLIERLATYFPVVAKLPLPSLVRNLIIPLNLFDSILVVCGRREAASEE